MTRLSIIKVWALPQTPYAFNAFAIKIPKGFFEITGRDDSEIPLEEKMRHVGEEKIADEELWRDTMPDTKPQKLRRDGVTGEAASRPEVEPGPGERTAHTQEFTMW